MAQARNTFIKSKLNKDLDARLMPQGEYRDAVNVQVSKSEGESVGSLENVLGNTFVLKIDTVPNPLGGVIGGGFECIGEQVDESNGFVYLFLTNNFQSLIYAKDAKNYIIQFDTNSPTGGDSATKILVQGAFLNFSTDYRIYASNVLEDFLFWTDNYNQPRKINIKFAEDRPAFYFNEDQISVAKYNPYQSIELWQASTLGSAATVPYETTMKDVTSKFLPNGGEGSTIGASAAASSLQVVGVIGQIAAFPGGGGAAGFPTISGASYGAATIGIVDVDSKAITMITDGSGNNAKITGVVYFPIGPSGAPEWSIKITGGTFPAFNNTIRQIVFNPNPYYNENFAGDPAYLEDKFVRFSYRYRFDDNEYSIMAPFTQPAFIPKQDGYFAYNKDTEVGLQLEDDQTAAYRSTIVSFMENKVDDITLRIPLPYSKANITKELNIQELEILYKESDGLAIKVIDTIPIAKLTEGTSTDVIFDYNYISKKPIKTLPSDVITRVYDRVPVRAFSQEIASNRIVYGNFQNKHTPPASLDYNVGVSRKSAFNLQNGSFRVTTADTYAINAAIAINTPSDTINVGSFVSGTDVPALTQITETTGTPISEVKLNKAITVSANELLTVTAFSSDTEAVSIVEYPNSTVKQNRTYQVGVVLSDRYGRTSTVILSNNENLVTADSNVFQGDTIYSPYLPKNIEQNPFPGNSLKVLFNSVISSPLNISLGTPGIYNGDSEFSGYNPLGWYSYKIVVKQTEQEYYNVYLPGIMAAYPQNVNLEINKTSHTVLINDNINKVPRDLSEVGPDQRQFRSSVQLFGRVQNTNLTVPTAVVGFTSNLLNPALMNDQYFTGRQSHTVSTISTLQDLFDYNPSDLPSPSYFPQFYLLESNPLVARISTDNKIGQISTLNYSPGEVQIFSGTNVDYPAWTDNSPLEGNIPIKNISGDIPINSIVTGIGIPEGTYLAKVTDATAGNAAKIGLNNAVVLSQNDILYFAPGLQLSNGDRELTTPGIQYLSVYETEPVNSLLDIFWETASTGVISELNNLILNSSDAAGGIGPFVSEWNETIAITESIFNQPVFLVDAFGTNIPIYVANANPALATAGVSNIALGTVFNLNGINVQNTDPYFALTYNAAAGSFEIKPTANYLADIYFSTNETLRIFNFQILVTTTDVDGLEINSTFQIGPLGPANIAPVTTKIIVRGVQVFPGAGLPTTIKANRLISSPLVEIFAHNGASVLVNRIKDFTISLFSLTDLSAPAGSQNALNSGFFELVQSTDTATNTEKAVLSILFSTAMPASRFQFVITAQDAGGSGVQQSYTSIIDLSITPASVVTGELSCLDASNDGGTNFYPFVLIEITGQLTLNGFYLFPTQSLSNLATGTIVTIDNTNAVTSAGGVCPNDIFIPFKAATKAAVYELYAGPGNTHPCTECLSTPNPPTETAADFSGYTFEIT